MDKGDIEFTVGLNTSPAEQQLDMFYAKMKEKTKTSPLLQQVSNEYSQGFKMVGSPYDSGSNRFGVPSTQVLNTALVATTQTIKRFESALNSVIYMSSKILDDYLKKANQIQIGYTPSSFSEFRSNAFSRLKMTGNPYSTDPHLVGSAYSGYMAGGNNYGVPSTIVSSGELVKSGKTISDWSPNEFYTRAQVDAINYGVSHNDIFNDLIYKRREKKPYTGAYDTFNRLHNPNSAYDMYNIWKGGFGRDMPIGLPAPQEGNTEERKKITDEDKKDNVELNDKLLKWGKIAAIIYAVKKTLEGLAKAWKFVADTASSRNANLNQDLGFFTIDPEGALRANTDTTRAMAYAGIRNMGENSPVSKEGFDYMSQKFTEMWTAAMSGREVDARTTIDVQRLKDFFGIDLTPASLLTGQRDGKTATDVQIDVMKKVETQLSKLNEADQTTKGQVIDSLRNILGEEMINAIVANFNKNSRIDNSNLRLTVAERLEQAGGSALSSRDLTEKTTDAINALGLFKNSLEQLKNTIIEDFSPAFVNVTKKLTSFVEWLDRKMTKTEVDTLTPGGLDSNGYLNSKLNTTDEGGVFGSSSDRKESASEKLKNKKNANEVLDAIYEINPNLRTEGSLEKLKQNQYINDAYDALASGTLDENSKNPLERYLANYEYKGLKGIEALKLAEKKGVFGKGNKGGQWIFRQAIKGNRIKAPSREDYAEGWWGDTLYKNAVNDYKNWEEFFRASPLFADFAIPEFSEGGGSDWNPDKGYFNYLLDPDYYENADKYYAAILEYRNKLGDFGSEYIKSMNLPSKDKLWGKDMTLQFNEVVFTLELSDGTVVSSVRQTPKIVNDVQ